MSNLLFRNVCFFLFFVFLTSLIGCKTDRSRPAPDVSHIKAAVHIERFEQDLFALDTVHIATSLPALQQKYGTFAQVFFEQITGLNEKRKPTDPDNPAFAERVSGFINYPATRKLFDTTQIAYRDLSGVEADLSKTMQYYKYYFPKRPIPKFYSCISEYSIGAFTINDSIVGIGLDMFFGPKYPIYTYIDKPEYLTKTLDKAHLPVYVVNTLLDELMPPPATNRLLDIMVQNGKKLYIAAALMPAAPDSVLHCYTAAQTQWCADNEAELWSFFLEQKLLYSDDQKAFRRFTEPAPNSNGMPAESPGRTANYIGYKIVEQYMAKHPDLPLQTLLDERNAEKIFKEARYKPQK